MAHLKRLINSSQQQKKFFFQQYQIFFIPHEV